MFQRSAFQPSAFQVPVAVVEGPIFVDVRVYPATLEIALEVRPMISIAPAVRRIINVGISMPKIVPFRTRTNIEATFTDANGDEIDPGIVRFSLVKPDGTVIATTYPASLTNPSVGVYRYAVLLDQVGEWRYRWESADDDEESSAQDSIVVPRLNT